MTNASNDWSDGIPRMIALADRFAAEGQMNLNKIMEAAVYSQTRRAAWQYRPEVTVDTMQAELHKSIQDLDNHRPAGRLIPILEEGLRALSKEINNVLMHSEAPDVFVCRVCGFIAMPEPPHHCPDCGSWPGTFRKFIATFNGDNMEPIDPVAVIRLLGRNAVDLARLVRGLTEEQLTQKPAQNEWSMREHVAHFYDTQEMLETRIELMVSQNDPEIAAVAAYELAADEDLHPEVTDIMLRDFVDRRAKTVKQLEELPLKALWRTGRHTEFGQITIIRQVAYLAYHEQSHLPEIEDLRSQFT